MLHIVPLPSVPGVWAPRVTSHDVKVHANLLGPHKRSAQWHQLSLPCVTYKPFAAVS